MDVIIVGAGIGGLTLALSLQRAGIACRVYEAAPEVKALGLGVSLLPHCVKALDDLGLQAELARVAVATQETAFFNRFGQPVYREPTGRHGGYQWPQYQIHRGDLQTVLLHEFRERVGAVRLFTGWKCTGFDDSGPEVTAFFGDPATGAEHPPQRGTMLIACDGIHSVIRKQLHPDEGEPVYSGVNMWRGVARWAPYLTGASYVRAGWLTPGKLVIYPIRDHVDSDGRQLVNWVAEITTPQYQRRDWNRIGKLDDFIHVFEDWHFDWLDVPAMLRASDVVLEFPMVDQDPLPWWGRARVTLLGDAAHPMVPRGSNGAGQAILDAQILARCLAGARSPDEGLRAYEADRLPATAAIVRTNRLNPPDAILREVYLRSGDKPFRDVEDVISRQELIAISENYKRIAGYDRETLHRGS